MPVIDLRARSNANLKVELQQGRRLEFTRQRADAMGNQVHRPKWFSDPFNHFGIDCSKPLARVSRDFRRKRWQATTSVLEFATGQHVQRKRTSHEQS